MGLAFLVAEKIMRQIAGYQSRQKYSVNCSSFSDRLLWFINAASICDSVWLCVYPCASEVGEVLVQVLISWHSSTPFPSALTQGHEM